MQPLPWNPEQWLEVVNDAVQQSGHADEVVTALEVTADGWRVSVLPPARATAPDGPAPVVD